MTLLRVTVGALRRWTRLYTSYLHPDTRDRRRAEVESDLFEQLAAHHGDRLLPARLAVRVLSGLHHDILWRFETAREGRTSMPMRIVLATAVTLIAMSLWGASMLGPSAAPQVPDAPRFRSRLELRPAPPPPPPPPPLCVAAGSGRRSPQPCTKWP